MSDETGGFGEFVREGVFSRRSAVVAHRELLKVVGRSNDRTPPLPLPSGEGFHLLLGLQAAAFGPVAEFGDFFGAGDAEGWAGGEDGEDVVGL